MVELNNFEYDAYLDTANSGKKKMSLYVYCEDARDATMIMDALTRALGATDNLFTLRKEGT